MERRQHDRDDTRDISVQSDEPRPPTCFISYSWSSESHKDWIRQLATGLRQRGVDVILDQWNLRTGQDLAKFMESSIREADFVILVCTDNYKAKADDRSGGADWETGVITGEMLAAYDRIKFIPVIREGTEKSALPSYLRSRVYIDFRSDDAYEQSFDDLLREIWDSPLHVAPPLGSRPSFVSEVDS